MREEGERQDGRRLFLLSLHTSGRRDKSQRLKWSNYSCSPLLHLLPFPFAPAIERKKKQKWWWMITAIRRRPTEGARERLASVPVICATWRQSLLCCCICSDTLLLSFLLIPSSSTHNCTQLPFTICSPSLTGNPLLLLLCKEYTSDAPAWGMMNHKRHGNADWDRRLRRRVGTDREKCCLSHEERDVRAGNEFVSLIGEDPLPPSLLTTCYIVSMNVVQACLLFSLSLSHMNAVYSVMA